MQRFHFMRCSWLWVVGALTLLPGCGVSDEEESALRTVAQAQVTTELTLRYPQGSDGAVPVVAMNGAVNIRDRAKLVLPDGTPVGLAQLGSQAVELSASSHVGTVIAQGDVLLRSNAKVTGNVVTAGTISHQNGTTVTGTQTANATVTPVNEEVLTVPVHSVANNPVNLEPDQIQTRAPGQYSALNVKSRATLRLSTGDYAFSQVTVEPNAKLRIDDSLGAVRIFVDGGFTFRGQIITPNGEPPALLIVQSGSQQIVLDATFRGTVIAPFSDLILGPGNQPHEGAFWGKSVEVRADTRITYRPYFRLVGKPAFQVPSSGPAEKFGVLRADDNGNLLVEGPDGPFTVSNTGLVQASATTSRAVALGAKGDYFAENPPGLFRAYEADGTLVYERPRDEGSFGFLVPGSSMALLPEVTGDPEKLVVTHARFYDETGLVTRFPVPDYKVGALTPTHLVYSTSTSLVKVSHAGGLAWSVPLSLRKFIVSRDGNRLLGVKNTRAQAEVVHVDLNTGAVISSTTLNGPFWNMALSDSGSSSAVTSKNRLYVYSGGQLRTQIALPFEWPASVAVSNDGKTLVGAQRVNHVAALFLTGPPGAGAWISELAIETAGYRPDVEFLPGGQRFVTNQTSGLTVYDVVRQK